MTARLGLVFHPCGHQTPVPSGDRRVAFPCSACRRVQAGPGTALANLGGSSVAPSEEASLEASGACGGLA